jgi:hypothetical protein
MICLGSLVIGVVIGAGVLIGFLLVAGYMAEHGRLP